VSLYKQVIDTLRNEIVASVFKVGTRLPTEDVLAQRFAVSRHTIREALKTLRNEGLIRSRQGSGSVVIQSSGRSGYTSTVSSIDEIFQYAAGTRYAVDNVEMVVADATLAHRLDCEPGMRWLKITGFRFKPDDDTPVCWTEVFIRSDYAGVGALLDRKTSPIYSWIEEMYDVRVEEVEQLLTSAVMRPETAAKLGTEADHGIEVRRKYIINTGHTIEVAFSLHPIERFSFAMKLRRTATQSPPASKA
jgi:GntR family transcriptional regulator